MLDMLRKLLNTINLKWAQKARIQKTLKIQRGIGNHPYLTVKEGSLFFHTYPQIESFGSATEEVISHSNYDGTALPEEQSMAFRADFITEIRNRGTENVYLNFNIPTSEDNKITLKPGETISGFPRKVQTIYFHSEAGEQNFSILGTYTNMLYYQEVVIEGMSIRELTTTLNGMGYQTDTGEAERLGIIDESALLLLDTEGINLTGWADLYAFTSNWYRVLYPLHRVLSKFNGDVDTAIEQLLLPSAKGEWLEYWASFFRIRRLQDESDELLLRRTMLTLTSTKSNNKAMEELIGYYIRTQAEVLDNAPSVIEVRVSPEYMDSATKVREIIALLKSAGVDYFLNYQAMFEDNYPVYYMDKHGASFGKNNESFSKVTVTLPIYEEDYLYVPPELRIGFHLNTHKLNSNRVLSRPNSRVVESLGMTLTDGATGTIIQQM